MIEQLNKIPTEQIEHFLSTKDKSTSVIPTALCDYILELNQASNLFSKHQSITDCAKRLRKACPHLSIPTCKSRIYDAINYFNSDCTVTSQAWSLYYADQLMKLMEVNIAAHDFKEARICMEKAKGYRVEASGNTVSPDRLKRKHQIVSADMQLDRMGIQRNGLLDAFKKAKSIIGDQDISLDEKERLYKEVSMELGFTDAEVGAHED